MKIVNINYPDALIVRGAIKAVMEQYFNCHDDIDEPEGNADRALDYLIQADSSVIKRLRSSFNIYVTLEGPRNEFEALEDLFYLDPYKDFGSAFTFERPLDCNNFNNHVSRDLFRRLNSLILLYQETYSLQVVEEAFDILPDSFIEQRFIIMSYEALHKAIKVLEQEGCSDINKHVLRDIASDINCPYNKLIWRKETI